MASYGQTISELSLTSASLTPRYVTYWAECAMVSTCHRFVSLLDRVVLSVPEAARQLRIPQSTLRHWLEGHTVRDKRYEPVLRPAPEGHNQITWGEMVEASYLRRYREHQVPMQQLRPFIERAREVFDTRYQ